MLPTVRVIDKEYVFNERFKVLYGKEFWTEKGEIVFPEPHPHEKGYDFSNVYRTQYGWNFAHNGVILGKCNYNLRLGLRRMLCKVFPDCTREECGNAYYDAYDQMLINNQHNWIRDHGHEFKKAFDACYTEMDKYQELLHSAEFLTTLPHPKMKLRADTYKECEQNGTLGKDVWADSVEWKQKTDEIAKFLKYIRMIVDLGCAASLQGAVWTEWAKKLLASQSLIVGNCRYRFVNEPAPQNIADVIFELWNSEYDIDMIAFSDDAAIVVKENNRRVYAGNLDFRSNDMCKGDSIYKLFHEVLQTPEDVRIALDGQGMLPIRVKDCVDTNIVLLKPLSMYQQSGKTDTTVLNTFTWMVCFYIMTTRLKEMQTNTEKTIISCVEALGHSVTCEPCTRIQEIQFLKMSLAFDKNFMPRAMINLGVIIRASGVCRGDLPGRGDIATRAKDFQHTLMEGLLTGIGYKPLRKLQPDGNKVKIKMANYTGAYDLISKEKINHDYTTAEFYARYNVTDAQIEEFEEMISQSRPGTTAYCELVDIVLNKDYGLNCPLL